MVILIQMKLFANIVASILHPATLILPAVFLIVYKSAGDFSNALFWTFVSLVFTGVVALFVLIGVKKGIFTDIDVSVKKQRVILYPFVVAVTLIFSLVIYLAHGPSALIIASFLFVSALVILDVINLRIKASVHVASITAMVIGIINLYGGFSYFLLLLVPLVAWARIYNRRHTLKETIVGAICGCLLTLSAIIVVQFFL